MNSIVHFEIHVGDIERAEKFYADVFGWTYQEWPMPDGTSYVGVITKAKDAKEGINGGMMLRKGEAPKDGQPINSYVSTMLVENIDTTIAKILELGGTEALPKFAIMGMAWQAYYKDLEGNIFGIHQVDTNAK